MWNPWVNFANQGIVFPKEVSQRKEAKLSPQKSTFKETWRHTFESPRHTFGSPQKSVTKKAVKRLEFSPRSTVKMKVYFENINGYICLTKVRPVKLVRWKLLKKKYWPLEFHPAIMSKQSAKNKVYDMKYHKTIQITLTDREAEPYLNGKYIDIPKKPILKTTKNATSIEKKPKPKTTKKATPAITVNIRHETNNIHYNSRPSTSKGDLIKYEDDQVESSDSGDYSSDSEEYSSDSEENSSDSEEYSSDAEENTSYVHNESRYTNNVYYD